MLPSLSFLLADNKESQNSSRITLIARFSGSSVPALTALLSAREEFISAVASLNWKRVELPCRWAPKPVTLVWRVFPGRSSAVPTLDEPLKYYLDRMKTSLHLNGRDTAFSCCFTIFRFIHHITWAKASCDPVDFHSLLCVWKQACKHNQRLHVFMLPFYHHTPLPHWKCFFLQYEKQVSLFCVTHATAAFTKLLIWVTEIDKLSKQKVSYLQWFSDMCNILFWIKMYFIHSFCSCRTDFSFYARYLSK